jgi:hypothetical protein
MAFGISGKKLRRDVILLTAEANHPNIEVRWVKCFLFETALGLTTCTEVVQDSTPSEKHLGLERAPGRFGLCSY